MVKSNAYGHGMELIAGLAERYGTLPEDENSPSSTLSFCVHSLDEALRLRRAHFSQDVLIMGHVPLARLAEAVKHNFRLVLFNLETAQKLAEVTKNLQQSARLHLKIETGTYRQGIAGSELDTLLGLLQKQPRLKIEGVYTHFANIEDTTQHDYAKQQLARFENSLREVKASGAKPEKCHAACSAAALLFPQTHFDMVRLGISQYGIWSSKETFLSYQMAHPENLPLTPILTWKARISQIKWVPANAFIGYGCTYQTTRKTRIAILPIGYSDGYDRRLSNQGHVLIQGRRAPIRGRVCMNLIMVDVTDIPEVCLEEEAVLIGQQGDQRITPSDLADLTGTIPYEIVTRIQPELPRLLAP